MSKERSDREDIRVTRVNLVLHHPVVDNKVEDVGVIGVEGDGAKAVEVVVI